MKLYSHGYWCHNDQILAYMYRGEDGLIYYENTQQARERKLRIVPEGAEIIEGVAFVPARVSNPGIRTEVGDHPDVADPVGGGAHDVRDRVRIRDRGPD